MVLFNDPIECPDPSLRAVRMAIEMRACIAALASKWREKGCNLGFGVGIAHGEATLGQIGFEGRLDYSAIGRTPNIAARLCSMARDGQILIDPKVQKAVAHCVEWEEVGELELKGGQASAQNRQRATHRSTRAYIRESLTTASGTKRRGCVGEVNDLPPVLKPAV